MSLTLGGPLSGSTSILTPADATHADALWRRERDDRLDDLRDQAEDRAREMDRSVEDE